MEEHNCTQTYQYKDLQRKLKRGRGREVERGKDRESGIKRAIDKKLY